MFLKVRHLSYTYFTKNGAVPALQDINFCIKTGEFITIVGSSGCGKSTLLDLIGGYLPLFSGKIIYPTLANTPSVGYMLQKDHLLEHLTIYRNAILGLEITKQNTPERLQEVHDMLTLYGLDGFEEHYPRELSGGMRQRVALVRTLAMKPDFLLLDEPFSALDYQTRLEVISEISSIIRKKKITTLMVTHDLAEAISIADRVIILSERPATVRKIIPIQFEENRHLTPDEARLHPKFQIYFNKIWKELKL